MSDAIISIIAIVLFALWALIFISAFVSLCFNYPWVALALFILLN